MGRGSRPYADDTGAEALERYPRLPWREMATFRNFASHDYFGVDAHLVWQAAMSLEPIRAMVLEETARCQKQGGSGGDS